VAPFPARQPRDNEAISRGTIYVAPPDHHLIVKRGYVRTVRGPQENGFRPAIDPLFRTAASAYGPRVIGVVLSGGLDDGSWGLQVIKREGGIAIVQDPGDAFVRSMPDSAIENVGVDHVLPASEIGPMIVRLSREQVTEGDEDVARRRNAPPDVAEAGLAGLARQEMQGEPSTYTCPKPARNVALRRRSAIERGSGPYEPRTAPSNCQSASRHCISGCFL
jgi:two-component system chemotaxis response regulator CheB